MNHYKGWYNACKLTVRLLWGFNLEAVKDTSCCPFSPCDLLDYENYNIGQEQWNIVDTLVTCGWSWLCFDDLAFLSHDMQSNAGQDCPTTASTGISLEIRKKKNKKQTPKQQDTWKSLLRFQSLWMKSQSKRSSPLYT